MGVSHDFAEQRCVLQRGIVEEAPVETATTDREEARASEVKAKYRDPIELGLEARSEPQLVRLRGKGRIKEAAVENVAGIRLHEGRQQFCAAPGAATARVIGTFRHDHWPPVRRPGRLYDFAERYQSLDEALSVGPAANSDLAGERTGMGLVATRSDNDGNAVLSTVGENEAPKDRDV